VGIASEHLLGRSLELTLLEPGTALATSPVFVGAGEHPLQARPVVLRLQVARIDGEFVVLPGGVGRVLAPGDQPAHPSAQIAKDVWVVGAGQSARPVAVSAPPQVDFGSSVP
jgi:uncharacterized circularly permuted ATP-grasp superfamily protein